MNWANPENWLDLLAYGWYGVVLLGIAAVPSWLSIRTNKSIKEVSESVNNRPTALRDDLDRAIQAIEQLGHDMRRMRADLRAEEERRRSQIEQLYDELDHRIGKHRRN